MSVNPVPGLVAALLADDPAFSPLVSAFIKNLPNRLDSIQHAQLRSDWQELASQAHQMAGAAGGYGFPQIGRVAANIESLAKTRAPADILAQSIDRFRNLCRAAILGAELN